RSRANGPRRRRSCSANLRRTEGRPISPGVESSYGPTSLESTYAFGESFAMALSSMTGFARSQGASGPYTFEWELKSVNAKGYDLRLRLPPGWDDIEAPAKKRAAELLARGTVYANLNVKRANAVAQVRINEDVLNAVVKVAGSIAAKIDAVAPSVDGLLGIKGVIEVVEPESDAEEDKVAKLAAMAAFEEALQSLVDMRRREGATLGQVLGARVDEI